MFQKIKLRYDGYHFATVSEDIYNPFSLLTAVADLPCPIGARASVW
jgi:hypothetical protein